jgi:hypothetical protein
VIPKGVSPHQGPTVRLAYGGPAKALAAGLANYGRPPALLVSYVYLKPFDKDRPKYHFRDWAMDSGAYSAHNTGKVIDLNAFIAECQKRFATDPQLTEVFALDVIGDWKGSLKNTEAMWAAGVPAIPTYHQGEPWDVLRALARDYPKIGIGGMVGLHAKAKAAWVTECFRRAYPCKIHGLGIAGEKAVMGFPFHSTDATNWEIGPTRFGSWAAFGNAQLGLRGGEVNLRAQVELSLTLERAAQSRWAAEMRRLDAMPVPSGPKKGQ